MFFTADQLKTALRALDDARRTFDCDEPRRDVDGGEQSENGVSYGTHGAAYLQVDPESAKVRCGACAGDLEAIAQQKRPVDIKGRQHLVSSDVTPTAKKVRPAKRAKKGARR
jgi:hypothetical protein